MKTLLGKETIKDDSLLRVIAHMPTKSLAILMDEEFVLGLKDNEYMRIAMLLAQKSYDEGGCPIGAVIVNNNTRKIVGKGHNTLVQEDHPYNHGETSAIRDAGRIDFSETTIFTTLSPCDVCATLIYMRGFARVVVGDITNASGNENLLLEKGINVDILEDKQSVDLYGKFRLEKPAQEIEDWQGLSALNKS